MPATVFASSNYEFCIQLEMLELAGITFTKPLLLEEIEDGQDVYVTNTYGQTIYISEFGKMTCGALIDSINSGFVQRDEAPPVDGSDSADMALRSLYPRDSGTTLDLSDDMEMSCVFSELLAVREAITTQTALEAQLKQRIQQRRGDATRAIFDAGEVSWKRSKDGVALDTARLHKEHADLLKDYTIVKPGSRRFLVQT